jgi:2-iminobutanoate/2-iminopropanoate deaminase
MASTRIMVGYWRIEAIGHQETGMDASESTRRVVETGDAPEPIGPYSQAVIANGVLYCSGQVPLEPQSGELIEGGVAEQAARCLESLEAVCREAGTRLQDAARIGIFLTDMEQFPKVNDVYATFFEQPFPVRTTVGVAALPKGALVEMDATVPLPP